MRIANFKLRFSARWIAAATVLVSIVGLAFGCGSVERETIDVDGSSTVFLITQIVAEEYRINNPDVQIPIGISGTGGGFQRFVTGETDISNASRPIRPEEADLARQSGVEYLELTVANDGIAVIRHLEDDFVSCLTTEQLKQLWEPGSEQDVWNQVDAAYPDREIRLYGPDRDSGTFDYFTEEVLGEEGSSRSDYSASADDNVIIRGVSADRGSLGYLGYAYYAENSSALGLIAVDNGAGCIEPSPANIGSGSYAPLSRPLFIYVNRASLARASVRDFVTFYLDNAGSLASDVGYVGLTADQYADELAKLSSSN